MDKYNLTQPRKIVKNSWFYDKQRYIEALPFFWLRDPLKFLFGTELNKMTGAHEWRMSSKYSKHDFFYSMFWFMFCLSLLCGAAWISNFWNLLYNGFYLAAQWFFSESQYVDDCYKSSNYDYLMEFSMPYPLYDRYAFSSLRSVSLDEINAGYAENIYYAPTKAPNTIAFRTMMRQMRRWIDENNLHSKCVCFFHFGVGIQGGFYDDTFFINRKIIKESPERYIVTIGSTQYNVAERTSVLALGDTSCQPVESKIGQETSACLDSCGR